MEESEESVADDEEYDQRSRGRSDEDDDGVFGAWKNNMTPRDEIHRPGLTILSDPIPSRVMISFVVAASKDVCML